MREPLDDLLDRGELADGPILRADEVRRWPPGTLEQFIDLGLLRETSRARSIWYDGCDEGCLVEPEVREDRRTGGMVAAFACRREGCGGLITLDLACLRRWEVDTRALARHIADVIGAKGRLVEDVPGRLWLLGTVTLENIAVEMFLGRGLGWNDAATILDQAHRLGSSPAPVVLTPSRHAAMDLPEGRPSALVRLPEVASMHNGRIDIDLAVIAERVAASALARASTPRSEQDILVEAEIDILEALAQSPQKTMLQIEIMTAAGYSKTVTRDALEHLRELGFVAKPNGSQRKGDVITTKGREYLSQRQTRASRPSAAKA